jgi:curved DNA-binding protein CbpA
VKKAYLRVVRFVHPDKLPLEIETASKHLVERVFIHLTQKYDLYRKAHELG